MSWGCNKKNYRGKIMNNKIKLYHGTCKDSANILLKNGWKSGWGFIGGNSGDKNFLHLTSDPYDALWFAQEKGCNIVLEIRVPISDLKPDKIDEAGFTIEDLFYRMKTSKLPAKFMTNKNISPEDITIHNNINENINVQSEESLMFFKKYHIDPDESHYLGRGDFGMAYEIDGNRVLKITSSKQEYELAKYLIGKQNTFDTFVEYFVAEEIDGRYWIIMEKLEEDPQIENLYYSLDHLLQEAGYSMGEIEYFDEEEYEQENGEIDEDLKDFFHTIKAIKYDYNRLGIKSPDIKPDNLGVDKHGDIKAFDISGRGR